MTSWQPAGDADDGQHPQRWLGPDSPIRPDAEASTSKPHERDRQIAVLAGKASAAAAEVAMRTPEPDRTAAAFFDVDNTMTRGASVYYFARGLVARDLFTTHDLVRFGLSQLAFRVSGKEDRDHMQAAREAALTFVSGRRVEELVGLAEEIYDDLIADRIWEGTRNLARRHLEAGQRVWLVTAAPIELAEVIARRLGLTGALGTVAERVDGSYTGKLVGDLLHGPVKSEAVRALAEREDLVLSRCSAYSDSANDLPMLRSVGHPNVVNPDSELKEIAKRNAWPIFEFRTGRKATLYALSSAAGAGAAAGAIGAGLALRNRYRTPRWRRWKAPTRVR